MLTEVNAGSYKSLNDNSVTLSDLVRVNYLVGENSSGKTTILRYIFDTYQKQCIWITDSFSDVDHLDEFDLKQSLATKPRNILKQLYQDSVHKNHFISLDLLAFSIFQAKTGLSWGIIEESVYTEALELCCQLGVMTSGHTNTNHGGVTHKEGGELNSGAHKLLNIVYSILWSKKNLNTTYVLIDNPGDRLHPSWQKKLPYLLHKLSELLIVQIFVATHSPFVISSVTALTQETMPTEKVYFVVNGAVANKHGVASTKGRHGYWGSRISEISAKMLGAGLMDLVAEQQAAITPDSPMIVLCEGEGESADGKIYSIIFRDRIPRTLFVSCRGGSQLLKTYTVLSQVKPALSADFQLRMLRDRDHEFTNPDSIKEYESSLFHARVLSKRAIECYMYQPSTASTVLSLFGKKLLKKDLEIYNQLNSLITKQTVHGIPGDEYKQQLGDWFLQATRGYLGFVFENTEYPVMEKIANLIYPGHQVYEELERDIFAKRV